MIKSMYLEYRCAVKIGDKLNSSHRDENTKPWQPKENRLSSLRCTFSYIKTFSQIRNIYFINFKELSELSTLEILGGGGGGAYLRHIYFIILFYSFLYF